MRHVGDAEVGDERALEEVPWCVVADGHPILVDLVDAEEECEQYTPRRTEHDERREISPQWGPERLLGVVGGRQDVCCSSLGRHRLTVAEEICQPASMPRSEA